MPFVMQPGRIVGSGGLVPNITNMDNGSITCNKGRVITRTSDVAVLHALSGTVTNMLGVSLEACTSGTSDGPQSTLLSVAKFDRNTEFVSKVIVSGAVTSDVSGLSEGDKYGFITVASQDYVDFDDTAQVVCQITKVDDNLNVVWFLLLESAIQDPNG